MTPLAALIRQQIAAGGPISIAQYMELCLLHPEHGYYTRADPLGAAGDFTTAPEISQMFGELLGLCLAQAWLDQGRPAPFTLAEPGPGRGTLMADALRAAGRVRGFRAAARLVLVEASPALRARQAETLRDARPVWVDTLDTLPETPLFLLANEFFDALPIRQYIRGPEDWRERLVGLGESGLRFGLGPPERPPQLAARLADTQPGEVVELCPTAGAAAAAIARRIAAHGGAAVIVDYGGWHSRGDTFQAVARHAPTDPLSEPGAADLTAHVDFEALASAATAAGAAVSPMVPQGELLDRLGMPARAAALARGLSGDALAAHLAAAKRLTHPDEMGSLFKAIAIHPRGGPVPPGFTT